MSKHEFLTEDLPEVEVDGDLLRVNGAYWSITGMWEKSKTWREAALTRLAIAEYLDNLKPKLPTEPGSVILASKVQGWGVNPRGTYLSLSIGGRWNSLENTIAGIRSELIEEWKPVKLVPQEEGQS